jgi:glycerol-3-phosphate O-acyltransferase
MKAADGLKTIENRQLRISRINELNDPYELRGVVSKDENIKNILEEIRKDAINNYGIICFSKTYTEPLLWSHYAEQHKGICLGFNVKHPSIEKISYVNKPELIFISNKSNHNIDRIASIYKSKYKKWSYEKEYRIFKYIRNMKKIKGSPFINFGENFQLNEIIIGHQSDLNKGSIEEKLINYPFKIQVHRSKMVEFLYKIEIEKHDRGFKRRRP